MKNYLALFLTLATGVAVAADNSETRKVGGSIEQATENTAPAFHQVAKDSELPALNYVNQPPMVPHAVSKYQVTKNTNQCLNCHSVEASRVTGATRISPTHFVDRDGNVTSSVAPRRQFCLQCHVSQSDVEPIIKNEFKPMEGYGK
ncbi:nitrate reductase cytochrome c-type subunit [Pasteurellaceae bacterium LIM206]|nr:nitrate reductase cytochrome c-type subunit [Pasteurellaceae bacterium LIM206]